MKNLYNTLTLIVILLSFCLPVFSEVSPPEKTTDTLVKDLFSKGSYAKAIKILRNEKEKDPDYYNIYCCEDSRAVIDLNKEIQQLKSEKKWNEVRMKYEQQIKVLPDSYNAVSYALYGIAKSFQEQNQYQKTLDIYKEHMDLCREEKVFYEKEGISLSVLGEVETRLKIAECHAEKGDYNKAIREYEKMIDMAMNEENFNNYSEKLKKETLEVISQWKKRINELKKSMN